VAKHHLTKIAIKQISKQWLSNNKHVIWYETEYDIEVSKENVNQN